MAVAPADSLSLAERRLLAALATGPARADAVAGFATAAEALVAADALARRGWLAVTENKSTVVALTAEGRRVAKEGLAERRALRRVIAAGGSLAVADLPGQGLAAEEATVAVGWLRRKKWADVEKTATGAVVKATKEPPQDNQEKALADLAAGSGAAPAPQMATDLAQRGLVEIKESTSRTLTLTQAGTTAARGAAPVAAGSVEVNQITPELVARWSTMSADERRKHDLRRFDLSLPTALPTPGKPHPLTTIINEIRDIFVSLGFQEIAGTYMDAAFWNMDALFIPQDHPAREMQDTFYVKTPAKIPVETTWFDKVRDVQLTGGGTGSTGWGGNFTRSESERPLLRTHTTVTTLRHLAANPKGPQKVFGVGRVFRNEAMDATHLPEFHQVEGILMEDGADFRMLLGILREFYARMGFPEVKFRPSYYPYTEPSLDVAVKWNDRWLELGGAGVFRPEVTQPLGVEGNVLAWGLGLERLAMMRLGLKDIRQLYVSDVNWLREAPLR